MPREDDRTGWDWSTLFQGWSLGVAGFGFLNPTASCPELRPAFTHTDISGLDVQQIMLRSWFYVGFGTVSVSVVVTSDQPAWLYVNGALVGEHTPADGVACPTSTEL